MFANKMITSEEYKTAKDEKVKFSELATGGIKAPHFVMYIKQYLEDKYGEKVVDEGGLKVTTTLDYDLQKAKKQFTQAKSVLHCLEYWWGPYPFYEDSYKLVEAPHLGMEHQSAVAYGNKFLNGYLGHDLSGSGWGNKWDFIIEHESSHEWFGNNITTNDIADMWVHEGFGMYAEALFVEYYYGKKAADEYIQGIRYNISNNLPVIGTTQNVTGLAAATTYYYRVRANNGTGISGCIGCTYSIIISGTSTKSCD